MKSAIRPSRGRPSKVTKAVTPGRARPGRSGAAQQLAAHEALHDHDLKEAALAVAAAQDHSVFGNPAAAMGADYAAAAAAMEADMGTDGQPDDEAEADMDDDDPSAGASLASHVDLSAANILANGGAGGSVDDQHHQHHQHHPQMHPDLQQGLAHAYGHQQPQAQMGVPHELQQNAQSMDPSIVKFTEQMAIDSGYSNLNIESALAKRLAREPGRRLATQRRPEQALNLGRRSNVEALFAHIAGEPARVACKNCHKGHGPWVNCIVVEGQMCGSCANCWFNASGARCSFHETRNPQSIQQQHAGIMSAGNASLPADPGFRFSTPHSLMAPNPGPVMGNVNLPTAAMMTSNPNIQGTVNRAMNEVRSADKAARQLMLIDITAKQLALQIAEYEETLANQSQGPSPQAMGDESGA